jgi:Flp pilus assembly protein TadG
MAALKRTTSLRRRWCSEKGAELIEFGLVFPLLLLVVLGIVDFGFLFQQYEVVTNAAREGARVVVLPGYAPADANARALAYLTAAGLTNAARTSAVGAPQTVSIGGNCMSTVSVTVTYPHQFVFLSGIGSYFGSTFGTATLSASSTMRKEVAAAACP